MVKKYPFGILCICSVHHTVSSCRDRFSCPTAETGAEGDVVPPLPFQQIRNDQGDPVALFTGKVMSVDIRLIPQSADPVPVIDHGLHPLIRKNEPLGSGIVRVRHLGDGPWMAPFSYGGQKPHIRAV